MIWRAALIFASSSLSLAAPCALAAEKPAQLAVGVGAFSVRDQTAVSPMASLQYYAAYRLFEQTAAARFQGIGPILGLSANTDGGVFGYGGAYVALRVLNRIHLLPSAGIGGYARGHSKNLGGVFEFHLGAALFYQPLSNDWLPADLRLGVTYTHISNAFIHDRNPGADNIADNILVSISTPLSMDFWGTARGS
ncbi:acyloxyacyl hydrolase [Nitrococcus mobilis]|nr:acyloxyacyl hydrolase [Nitrococcus mobilis]